MFVFCNPIPHFACHHAKIVFLYRVSIYLKICFWKQRNKKLNRKWFNIKILIIEKVKHIYRKFALLFNMPIYVNKYYCT